MQAWPGLASELKSTRQEWALDKVKTTTTIEIKMAHALSMTHIKKCGGTLNVQSQAQLDFFDANPP